MPPVRNLHVTLPEDLHTALREEVSRSGQAATELAREALRDLLARRRKAALSREILDYASRVAGTRHDLDPELEAAALETLLAEEPVDRPVDGAVKRTANKKERRE